MQLVSNSIEVIAHFEKGNVRPIKIKHDDQVRVIHKILDKQVTKLAGIPMINFTCGSINDDVMETFLLKYDINNCTWMLWK